MAVPVTKRTGCMEETKATQFYRSHLNSEQIGVTDWFSLRTNAVRQTRLVCGVSGAAKMIQVPQTSLAIEIPSSSNESSANATSILGSSNTK